MPLWFRQEAQEVLPDQEVSLGWRASDAQETKPHEDRNPEDYRLGAENSIKLAKVLTGRRGINDQDFLERH